MDVTTPPPPLRPPTSIKSIIFSSKKKHLLRRRPEKTTCRLISRTKTERKNRIKSSKKALKKTSKERRQAKLKSRTCKTQVKIQDAPSTAATQLRGCSRAVHAKRENTKTQNKENKQPPTVIIRVPKKIIKTVRPKTPPHDTSPHDTSPHDTSTYYTVHATPDDNRQTYIHLSEA